MRDVNIQVVISITVKHFQMATQRKDKTWGCILTVNLRQILTSTVTPVIFGEEQMGAAGACQKCSIENVNKQTEKKISLFNVFGRWGSDRMRNNHVPFPRSQSGNQVT